MTSSAEYKIILQWTDRVFVSVVIRIYIDPFSKPSTSTKNKTLISLGDWGCDDS